MMRDALAVRFDRDLKVGRNKPVLLACEVAGETKEMVAKFTHRCERGVNALAAESIAAMFAADLGLPVPEPFVVRVDPDLQGVLHHSIVGWPAQVDLPAYGSLRLPPGFATIPLNKPIGIEILPMLAEILAFDAIINNSDRLPRNPNCLVNGKSLAIIDHELAFPTFVIGWRPPWEPDALAYMGTGPSTHLFYDRLKGQNPDLTRLSTALAAITDMRIREYGESLPQEWVNVGLDYLAMTNHLTQARDSMTGIVEQVKRILL